MKISLAQELGTCLYKLPAYIYSSCCYDYSEWATNRNDRLSWCKRETTENGF